MALTKVSTGMLKADAASVDLNIDDGSLYIDAANNRVGIANQTPSTALEVTGTATATLFSGSGASLTSIPNIALDNSSITINSYNTALGGSVTLVTDDILEGGSPTNLYFTTQRARDSFSAGTGVTITNGEVAIGQPVGTTDTVTFDTLTVSTTATVPYDNTISGLTATNVQSAITELNTLLGGGNVGSQATWNVYEFTTVGNDTSFDISTQGSPAPSYVPGYVKVYLNGLLLSESDYTAVDGSTVNFSPAIVDSGQIVSIVVLDSFNTAELLRVTSIDASASTNSISIDSTDKVTLSSLDVNGNTGIVGNQPRLELREEDTTDLDVYLRLNVGDFTVETRTDAGVKVGDRIRAASNGDISFYDTTGSNAKLFWDASAESLRIGGNFNNPTSLTPNLMAIDSMLLHGIGSAPGTFYFYRDDVTIVSDDTIGTISFTGADGVDKTGATIEVKADANWSATSCPADIVFSTTEAGSTAPEPRLRIDSAGNVGIGTSSSVDSLLHLSASSGPELRIENTDSVLTEGQVTGAVVFEQNDDSTSGTGITGRIQMRSSDRPDSGNYFGNVADMDFLVSGASSGVASDNASKTAMTIRAGTGNVGIGTTSPRQKLEINGGMYTTGFLASPGTPPYASREGAAFDYFSGGGRFWSWGDTSSPNERGTFSFIQLENDGENQQTALTIDTSGNVGIGQSSPSGLLHLASTGGANIKIEDTDNGFAATELNVENGGRDFKITTPQDTIFVQGSTEAIRIDSSGNVGIGTGASPSNKLHVEQSVDGALLIEVENPNTGASSVAGLFLNGQGNNFFINNYGDGTTKANITEFISTASGSQFVFSLNSIERMRIDNNGNIITGATGAAIVLEKQGTATDSLTQYSSDELKFLASGWDTNANNAKIGAWMIRNDPVASIYPDFDLNFYDDFQNEAQLKVSFHARGTANHADPKSATFYGNVEINQGDQAYTNAGPGNLTINDGDLLVSTTNSTIYTSSAATTASDGFVARNDGIVGISRYCSATTNKPMYINRTSTDGDFIDFRKDGTAVGSIGTTSNGIYLGSPSGAGKYFANNGNFSPSTNGSKNLGDSTLRWQDLYLSGGAYLGGVAAANKLDDYEEGTWTPNLVGDGTPGSYSSITRSGTYTKVGNMVTANFYFYGASGTGNGKLNITGFPFTQDGASAVGALQYNSGLTLPSGTGVPFVFLATSSTTGEVRCNSDTGGTFVEMDYPTTANYVRASVTYQTS